MTTTTLRLHHLMPLLPLLLLLLLAAAAAGSGTGPPSFWAMDPRLMSPPPAERAGPTARDQFTTEGLVWERYQQRAAAAAARGNGSDGSSSSGGSGGQPPFPLQTARHVRLLKGVLEVRRAHFLVWPTTIPPTSVHHPTNPHPHHTHAIQGFPERIPHIARLPDREIAELFDQGIVTQPGREALRRAS